MNTKLLSLLFLLYLSSTYCSDCSEKTTFEDEDEGARYYECQILNGKDYYCHIIEPINVAKRFIVKLHQRNIAI